MNEKPKQIITLLLLIFVSTIPAIHKINSAIPPEWFLNKFEGSMLDVIPYGLEISFFIILLIELVAPIILIFSLFKLITNNDYSRALSIGFLLYYTLFLILTFGSFLVEDYSNAFKDFIYFVGLVIIENFMFDNKKRAPNEALNS